MCVCHSRSTPTYIVYNITYNRRFEVDGREKKHAVFPPVPAFVLLVFFAVAGESVHVTFRLLRNRICNVTAQRHQVSTFFLRVFHDVVFSQCGVVMSFGFAQGMSFGFPKGTGSIGRTCAAACFCIAFLLLFYFCFCFVSCANVLC